MCKVWCACTVAILYLVSKDRASCLFLWSSSSLCRCASSSVRVSLGKHLNIGHHSHGKVISHNGIMCPPILWQLSEGLPRVVQLDGELVDGVPEGLDLHGEALLGLVLAQLHVGPGGGRRIETRTKSRERTRTRAR